jgi:hypothetical protein
VLLEYLHEAPKILGLVVSSVANEVHDKLRNSDGENTCGWRHIVCDVNSRVVNPSTLVSPRHVSDYRSDEIDVVFVI